MEGSKSQLAEFLGNRFVLVVEPTINYRTSIKQFLANLKIKNVKLVGSAAEAKREMLTRKIGFLIVEWSLAEQNGLQFCREVRTLPDLKDVPFLLLSVENLKRDVILASEVGIDGYLLKPFSYEDFCAQVNALVRLKQQPSMLKGLLDEGDVYLLKGQLNLARDRYTAARALKATSARALCGLARIADAMGDRAEAFKLLEESIAANPNYIEAHRQLLQLYDASEDGQGLLKTGLILIDLSPDNPRYALVVAKAYLDLRDLEKSERYFRQAIRLSPKLAEAYKGLGNVYLAQEDYEQAKLYFHKALDLDARDISILNSLGTTYVRQGQLDEGIKKYFAALKLDPLDPRVHFNLAQAYEKKEDWEKARYYYNQALIRNPDFEKAQRGLTRISERKTG